jgi:hypothetical protein
VANEQINSAFLGLQSSGGVGVDAFGRQRVSDTGQRLDVEFLYDKQRNFFDEITSNGTVTFNCCCQKRRYGRQCYRQYSVEGASLNV